MATFTATDAGADMMVLFTWADGVTLIDQLVIVGEIAYVNAGGDPADQTAVSYENTEEPGGFSQSGVTPTGGTFTRAGLYGSDGNVRGTLDGFTVQTDNFAHIIDEGAYEILDGDDTLNGGTASDILFGGFEGSDTYVGGGGGGGSGTVGDTFLVAAATTPISISGTGGQTDTITVVKNLNGQGILNLRETELSSINQLVINDGLIVHLKSSQIGAGAGISPTATILSAFGAGLLVVFKDGASAIDLSGFTVTGDVAISLLGTSTDDTITCTNGNDIVSPGLGKDTVNALGGNDTFNVFGTDSEFDTFEGGSGGDKIEIFGTTALTLNGFNAASQSIETWKGNGQGLSGNGGDNTFNLAGLTTKTGLTVISGLGGKDTITGSKFADTIAAAGTEAQFDTMNGGFGTDTFRVDGSGPLTLNGFNAGSQSIEVWDGNGQGVVGNGGANAFNLAGLTAMTDLPFIDGGAGDDTIAGSGFADTIRGGLGVDTMTGGVGGDRFDFDAVAEIGKKKGLLDLITDWGDGDTIDLSSIDANGAKKGDKAWKFLKKEGADFTKAGQVGFDQKKAVTYVEGDTNGDGKADFKLAVTGKIDFEKADFVL